jgi:hypothetical protein
VSGWADAMTLIDVFVVMGVGIVLPLALPTRWWAVATVGVVIALLRPEGWSAALFVIPWVVVASVLLGQRLLELSDVAELVMAGFALVAAAALVQSRLGVRLFGIREPIVELTAVHFTYAGVGGLGLARANLQRFSSAAARLAVVLTAAAPPVVATGFVTGLAIPQVGGAGLLTAGVWLTGILHLRAAWGHGDASAVRVLLAISGVSVWFPMVLAIAWAAAQHWDVPALSVADMVRTHGVANAFGFTICGLVAGWLGSRAVTSVPTAEAVTR